MKKKLTWKPTSILHEFPTVDAIKIKNGQWNVGKESCSSPMKEGTVPLENKTRNRRLLHLIERRFLLAIQFQEFLSLSAKIVTS